MGIRVRIDYELPLACGTRRVKWFVETRKQPDKSGVDKDPSRPTSQMATSTENISFFFILFLKTLVSKENIFVNEYTQLCTSNQKNLKMMKMDNKPGEKNRFPQSCCETSDIEIDKQIQCRFQSFGRCL